MERSEGQILHLDFPIIKNEAQFFGLWSQYVSYLANLLCSYSGKAEKQLMASWLISKIKLC